MAAGTRLGIWLYPALSRWRRRRHRICLLGNPIEQALSPIIQNAAFEARGRDAVFLGCRVEPGELEQAVQGARVLHLSLIHI